MNQLSHLVTSIGEALESLGNPAGKALGVGDTAME